ncbi:hypothetical protein SARC_01209, partial [Sphaeroforma arctica JP610]
TATFQAQYVAEYTSRRVKSYTAPPTPLPATVHEAPSNSSAHTNPFCPSIHCSGDGDCN